MTGQSLYYMGSTHLRHGVLCLAEEAGVGKAAYALKLLQSDGRLTIATTAKDPETGRMRAQRYHVEGPVALVMTTTAFELDPEFLSRALVLTVDESATQTARIHARQRQAHTVEGLRDGVRRETLIELHQDAQRLLEPLRVVCPPGLLDGYSDLRVRARRDHRKLLSLVEAVVLLHQFQRQRESVEVDGARIDYLAATPDDVELARRLLLAITPGVDELPRHTASVYQRIVAFVRARAQRLELRPIEVRFRRRELAGEMPLSPTQLKLHLGRLVDAELLLRHTTGDGGAAYSVRVLQYDAGGPGGGREGVGLAGTLESSAILKSWSEGGRLLENAHGPDRSERPIRTDDVRHEEPGEPG